MYIMHNITILGKISVTPSFSTFYRIFESLQNTRGGFRTTIRKNFQFSITSSTTYRPRVAAVQGRLNGAANSWTARVRNINQWIQIDLGKNEVVTAIATQGRANLNQWVTSYYVSYSLDGNVFVSYKTKGVVKASSNYRRYIKYMQYLRRYHRREGFYKTIDRFKEILRDREMLDGEQIATCQS